MTTKIATSYRTVTDQATPATYDSAKFITRTPMDSGTYVARSSYWAATCVKPAIQYVSEKSAEAQRQIDRVRSISTLYHGDDRDSEKFLRSISSTVFLISAFVATPIPIPVASGSESGETSLFFNGDNFYGDLEIIGNTVEYYIKFTMDGKYIEFFDSEKIDGGFIPQKLLTRLFYYYAQK